MNDYYEENAAKYIKSTISSDMSSLYSLFEKYIPRIGTILDLGFGSGRDLLYFRKQGYETYGVDPSLSFCKHLNELGFAHIYNLRAQDINFQEMFDGIWACASLLHVPSNELNSVFKKCSKALRNGGVIYISFKYGKFEGERDGRFYLDLNEDGLRNYLENTSLTLKEVMISEDSRKENDTKWLNAILIKSE